METEFQSVLFADVEQFALENTPGARAVIKRPRLQMVNRNQLLMRVVDIEQLIEPKHPARAVWKFIGERDLSRFHSQIEASKGVAGRPARDPRLMVSLWICAYMEGVQSAREIERQWR